MENQNLDFSDLVYSLTAPIRALELIPWIVSSVTQSYLDETEVLTFDVQNLPPPPAHKKQPSPPPPIPPIASTCHVIERRGL